MVLWACRFSPGSHVSVNDNPQMEVLTWHFYQAWETLGTSGERVAPYSENMNTSTSEQLPLNHSSFSFKQLVVFQVPSQPVYQPAFMHKQHRMKQFKGSRQHRGNGKSKSASNYFSTLLHLFLLFLDAVWFITLISNSYQFLYRIW